MRKLLLSLALVLSFSFSTFAQNTLVQTFLVTATGTTPTINVRDLGYTNFKIKWVNNGPTLPSACTILLQTSYDPINFSGAATGITGDCTSNGVSSLTALATNAIRLNLSVYTAASAGGITVTITATGASAGSSTVDVNSLPTPAGQKSDCTGACDPVVITPWIGNCTDKSGTITSGAVSQTLVAANATRHRIIIENYISATSQGIATAESLWINFLGASTLTAGVPQVSGMFEIGPGGSFDSGFGPVSGQAITVTGTTTNHKFAACEQ